MSNQSLGRAVLELSTDSTKYFAEIDKADKKANDLGATFKKTSKEAEGLSAQSGKLGGSLSSLKSIAGALGVSLSIGAIVSFGRELMRTGDEIVKTSERTGLMTEEVQRLNYIADQSGNSLEEMTSAIGQLQNRLVSGDKSAVAAVKTLGLNLNELRNASPYKQLELTADAIGKIPNPAQRAQVAMDLFGKSGVAILPTLTSEFKKLGDAAPVMSDSTVRALESAGDALNTFQLTAKVWAAESYNYAGRLFDGMVAYIYNGIAAAYAAVAALTTLAAKIPGASKLGVDASLVNSFMESARWYRDAASAMTTYTDAAKKAAPAIAPLPPLVRQLTDEQKKAAAEAKRLADAIRNIAEEMSGAKLIEQVKRFDAAMKLLSAAGPLDPGQVLSVGAAASALLDQLRNKHVSMASVGVAAYARLAQAAAAYNKAASEWPADKILLPPSALIAHLGAGTIAGAVFADQQRQVAQFMKDGPTFPALDPKEIAGLFPKQGWFQSVGTKTNPFIDAKALGADVSRAITQAFAGGGSPGLAAGSVIGSSLATGAATKFGTNFAASFAGKALGAALPAIGALAGPLLEKAFGGIFKTEGKKVNDLRDQFLGQFGKGSQGFHELARQLHDLGPAGDALFQRVINAKKVKDFEAAMTDANAALDAQRQKLAAFNGTLQTGLQRVKELGGGVPDALRPMLEQLREGKKLTQENLDLLEELAGGGTVNWKKLEEAAGRYGASTEKLGQQFHAAKLHEAWQQIIDDIDLFEKGQVDVNGLLVDMADEISGLVQTSMKFGTEIPENMRPWIAKLIEAGLLLDDSGEKITDIGKLKFGDTLLTSLEKLVLEIRALIDTLNKVPTSVNVTATVRTRRVEEHDNGIDVGEMPGVTPMARGGFGRIATPTLFLAGEAGPEDFAFSGANKRFGDTAQPSSAGTVEGDTYTVNIYGDVDSDERARKLAEDIARQIRRGGRTRTLWQDQVIEMAASGLDVRRR